MTDFHAFEKGGQDYLFFPRSARLYELSPTAAGLLPVLSAGSASGNAAAPESRFDMPSGPAAVYPELCELLQRELAVPLPISRAREEPGSNCFQTFSIYLAQSCNMSCSYCWNRGGSFGKPDRLMGRKHARLATDLILSLLETSSASKVFVNFYGGEPLLNFAALKRITLELRRHESRLGKNFHFTVDTNGSLLSGDTARFLARHFAQIGVSLDGREEIHDGQRPGKSGEPTWRRIVDNIRAFPNPRLLGLRATLTASSDSYLDTYRHLTAFGVSRIQLEYCHEPGYHESQIHQGLIVRPERQLAELSGFVDYYIDTISRYPSTRDLPFVSNVLDNIARMRRGHRFTKPCGAGINTLAINSSGDVFPCIAFVDREDFAMGRVGAGGDLALHRSLSGFEVDGRPACRSCWLRYDCAGGCYATHYDMTGYTRRPHPEYCLNMRGKAEVYLYAMARMLKKCPWHLEREP